jgi:ABC-type nitrate/sulfonate/bicarbonate transport system substrate-binding protein
VRLKVVDTGTALEAAKAFSDKKVDLAVVRGDVGDLSKAQAVVVMSHVVALVIAPPGSSIDSMDKLKGRRVGVLGGDANTKIVEVCSARNTVSIARRCSGTSP